MTINVRIRDGMCPDPTTGEGGATEGDIRGSFSDIIGVVGVKDLAGGHCAVTQNSPAALSVLVAPGIVYIPNADYNELDSNEPKFYEAIIDAEAEVAIGENTSGSTRIDLICVKIDKTITPDKHASNIATLVAVAGTPGAGAPTLPDNYAKLAEVEVANGASTIVNADIISTRVQSKIDFDFLPKATGAEINTGTEDAKIVTPKAIADSKLADYIRGDGWISANETWTYASATTFTVPGDQTLKYTQNTKIKLTQNTVKYFKVASSSYSSPNTTVTIYTNPVYTFASATITDNYYSYQFKPQGYPSTNSINKYIKIYKNATQNIDSVTVTVLTWNGAESGYDSSLFSLSSNTVVINSDDIKSIKCDLFCQTSSSLETITYVYKNGERVAALGHASYNSSALNSIIVSVAKDDVIDFRIWTNGAATITNASDWNYAFVTVNENYF